jgi:hypothetical protein
MAGFVFKEWTTEVKIVIAKGEAVVGEEEREEEESGCAVEPYKYGREETDLVCGRPGGGNEQTGWIFRFELAQD